MPPHVLYQLLGKIIWSVFVFAFGSCVGSLINVLVYRLPIGLSVWTPPSRCPSCETRLTWRENIPVFGWLLLGGKCRFCKSRISPEYPLVELFTGLLFVLIFFMWYQAPAHWLGIDWDYLRPFWVKQDFRDSWPRTTWPILLVILSLVGSLIAMTLVDAKTFTIPLQLPWFATIVGVLGHTGYAAWIGFTGSTLRFTKATASQAWMIPTPMTWSGVGAAIAGVVGLGVSLLLLQLGLIRRSFADYAEWEAKAREEMAQEEARKRGSKLNGAVDGGGASAASANGTSAAHERSAAQAGAPEEESGRATATKVAAAPSAVSASDPELPSDPEMWLLYPHARREMVKEMAFLAPCVLLGYGVFMLLRHAQSTPSLTMQVLGGVLTGYLVGGGTVWLVRILGSLAFGKEAMGLGDAHLMGAVGACLGWSHSVLSFFGAAFVGIAVTIFTMLAMGSKGRQLPYGPHLAIATVLILLFRHPIDMLLERLGLGILFP